MVFRWWRSVTTGSPRQWRPAALSSRRASARRRAGADITTIKRQQTERKGRSPSSRWSTTDASRFAVEPADCRFRWRDVHPDSRWHELTADQRQHDDGWTLVKQVSLNDQR